MKLIVNIRKRLRDYELNVNFETDSGVLSLLGASGCGKSMTLKCIAGIEKPDQGHIELDGRVLFDSEKGINLPVQKRHVGYLFQQYALFPNMTVYQNIKTGVRKKENADATVHAIMEKMGLAGLENERPANLSGGQQQRTALARILVNEPEVLLLDEPFSALDGHLRFRMEQEMKQVLKRFDRPVILVSHDRDEVYRLSERIAVMNRGHIEMLDEKETVFEKPRTKMAAQLIGCQNISAVEIVSERCIKAKDWGLTLNLCDPVSECAFVAIRRRDIYPDKEHGQIFTAVVESVLENPLSDTVSLRLENGKETLRMEVAKDGWKNFENEVLYCSLDIKKLLFLKEGEEC